MLDFEEIQALKERYNQRGLDLANERARVRTAYREADTKEQLLRILINGKLFCKIENSNDLATRNFTLSILQDMGFLDIGNLKLILDFMFSLPMVGGETKGELEYGRREGNGDNDRT